MKFAIVCTVLAWACAVHTLSVGGYGFKGPIFGSAPSKSQSQAELEVPIEENYLTPVDPKSEAKDERIVTSADPELAHKPTFDGTKAPQPEVESEAAVVEDDTDHVESKSETETKDADSILLIDPELVQQPTITETLAELGKSDILVKPSFLDKSPNPSILDPY